MRAGPEGTAPQSAHLRALTTLGELARKIARNTPAPTYNDGTVRFWSFCFRSEMLTLLVVRKRCRRARRNLASPCHFAA